MEPRLLNGPNNVQRPTFFRRMKILVLISQVPDTTARIAFTDGDTRFDTNGVQFIVNPYDEWYALVRGLGVEGGRRWHRDHRDRGPRLARPHHPQGPGHWR